jgi:hypothetical protein
MTNAESRIPAMSDFPGSESEFKEGTLKGILLRIVAALVLLALLTYAGDYLVLRYRMANGRSQFSSVSIHAYYAIHEKNGRTEYDFAQPETEVCVRSLFPHLGYSPCWYVNRHTDRRIDI